MKFNTRARGALSDDRLRTAVARSTDLLAERRVEALEELANLKELREAAASIRRRNIARLDSLLDDWSTNFEANGGCVHWARTAADANEIIAGILSRKAQESPMVVSKGKSMASEEIHLNDALARAGAEVIETDLGEFIIQLAGETPSHIIAPALHKDRFEIADLFSADGGEIIPAEISEEASYARSRLRKVFMKAGVGITGVNFAVAETGSICLVENEGNGRMCSSLPPVHIAIMGMERIVGDLAELDVMLNLLARSATGQAITVYTNLISGPRRVGEGDGPEELHVVVIDGGRSSARDSEFHEALSCIRCGACLNVCPVYRQVGGHTYESVYSGPIGAVLTPILRPDSPDSVELAEASTLCGACTDVCPVKIPLHDLLLKLRLRNAESTAPAVRRWGFRFWALACSSRLGWLALSKIGRAGLRNRRLLRALLARGWLGAWQKGRDLPTDSRKATGQSTLRGGGGEERAAQASKRAGGA